MKLRFPNGAEIEAVLIPEPTLVHTDYDDEAENWMFFCSAACLANFERQIVHTTPEEREELALCGFPLPSWKEGMSADLKTVRDGDTEKLKGIVASSCCNAESLTPYQVQEWRAARNELTRRGIVNYESAQVEPHGPQIRAVFPFLFHDVRMDDAAGVDQTEHPPVQS